MDQNTQLILLNHLQELKKSYLSYRKSAEDINLPAKVRFQYLEMAVSNKSVFQALKNILSIDNTNIDISLE